MSSRTFVWIVFLCGLAVLALRIQTATMSPEARELVREQSTYQAMRRTIEERYVDQVDQKKLFFGAMQGMSGVLDRHTVFWTPEEYDLEKTETSGHFAGIGIEIRFEEGKGLVIITPISGTPAFKAGLMPGDRIVKIDGTPVESLKQDQASQMIRGAPGTDVHLSVAREGSAQPIEFTITRAVIKVQSVPESGMLIPPKAMAARIAEGTPKIGYIQLTGFQEESAEDLEAALKKLEQQGAQGLILDLRQNRGGLLTTAVKICDTFISDGVIVTTRSRGPKGEPPIEEVFRASSETEAPTLPLAILIDSTSASASEIVAGCLHDHKRAVLVGDKSYGKGSVQTIIPVDMGTLGEGALKMTTAKYYTPADVCIDGKGIEPDYKVAFKLDQLRAMLYERCQRSLERNDPRSNGEHAPEAKSEPATAPAETKSDEKPEPGEDVEPAKPTEPFFDLQLEKAVEVLTKQIRQQ